MKLLSLLLGTLVFTQTAGAYELASTPLRAHQVLKAEAPMLLCANEIVTAKLYTLPSEKEAEMVVEGIEVAFMSHQMMQPMYTTEGDQVFASETSTLVLTETADKLQGVLSLDPNQPGLEQVMDCEAYYTVQPVAQSF